MWSRSESINTNRNLRFKITRAPTALRMKEKKKEDSKLPKKKLTEKRLPPSKRNSLNRFVLSKISSKKTSSNSNPNVDGRKWWSGKNKRWSDIEPMRWPANFWVWCNPCQECHNPINPGIWIIWEYKLTIKILIHICLSWVAWSMNKFTFLTHSFLPPFQLLQRGLVLWVKRNYVAIISRWPKISIQIKMCIPNQKKHFKRWNP